MADFFPPKINEAVGSSLKYTSFYTVADAIHASSKSAQ